ncbi:prepilin-type N-terminal cleavage/methylation domain-containing protein [bacterium]|nr:prepilin-type N-terminal cleavage/methylation domain-containing protein [bacterium]MBU1638135.1 prepilin-type N-terminal cleavage/methylation domain-containing protein [bacterium]MBU1920606.1 prepilin-type N-terminal cleavage/methylation domain-containing protein [bacterium]
MKKRSNNLSRQLGITIIELLVVVVVMGILSMVAVTRYLVAQDRAHVTAAVADADHFRKALAVYSVDYSAFPDDTYASPIELCVGLIDPAGRQYMVLPEGETFKTFRYEPIDEGNSYQIEITAKDNGGTTILATPDGTHIIG